MIRIDGKEYILSDELERRKPLMDEKEYQDKLKVRSQLSYLDRVRVAEYELAEVLNQIDTFRKRLMILEQKVHIEPDSSDAGVLE